MKKLELDFETRAKLTGSGRVIGGIIGVATGLLGHMEALRSIYDLARFSDQETSQLIVTDLADGGSTCRPPNPQWGAKVIEIEELWAAVLRNELETFSRYSIMDTQPDSWLRKLQAQLK